MVVSNLEGALLCQIHSSRQGIGDAAAKCSDLLIVISCQSGVQFVEMLLGQIDQCGEHQRWRGRCRVKVSAFDGACEIGACALLYGFQHRKQPP